MATAMNSKVLSYNIAGPEGSFQTTDPAVADQYRSNGYEVQDEHAFDWTGSDYSHMGTPLGSKTWRDAVSNLGGIPAKVSSIDEFSKLSGVSLDQLKALPAALQSSIVANPQLAYASMTGMFGAQSGGENATKNTGAYDGMPAGYISLTHNGEKGGAAQITGLGGTKDVGALRWSDKYGLIQPESATDYQAGSNGFGGMMGLLALAAAVYTGGAAAGLWGGEAAAGAAAGEIGVANAAEAASLATGTATGGSLVGTGGLLGTTGSVLGDAALNGGLINAGVSGITGGDPIKGFVTGAAGGAIGAGVSDLAKSSGITSSIAGTTGLNPSTVTGAINGATSAGFGALVNGTNLASAVATGALAGGASTSVKNTVGSALDGSPVQNTVAGLAGGATSGLISGAVNGNAGAGALVGGISGAVSGAATDLGAGPATSAVAGKVAGTLASNALTPSSSGSSSSSSNTVSTPVINSFADIAPVGSTVFKNLRPNWTDTPNFPLAVSQPSTN